MKRLLFILPSALLLVQSMDYFFSGYLSYVRSFVLIAIVGYYYISQKMKFDGISRIIITFLIYTFLISLYSSNYSITIPSYISIFVSMSFYIISYNTITNYDEFIKFKTLLFWIPLIYIISVIIFNFYILATSVYGGSGALAMDEELHHNTIYTAVLIIVLSFFLIKYFNTKYLILILNITLLIIIILSGRRTAIVLIVLSYLIYIILGQKKDVLKYILVLLIVATVTFPIYNKPLLNIIEARGQKMTLGAGIENASRILEIRALTSNMFNSEDINYVLFGTEYLNSSGTYHLSMFRVPITRILHTDYAVILHGSGIIGITIYFLFLILVVLKTYKSYKIFGRSNGIVIMLTCFTIILISVTFSGSILNITFRTTLFILFGALSRISEHERYVIF